MRIRGRPSYINVREWARRTLLWDEVVKEKDKIRKMNNWRKRCGCSYELVITRRWQD